MAPITNTTTTLLHLLTRSLYDTGAIVNNPPASSDPSYYGPNSVVNNGGSLPSTGNSVASNSGSQGMGYTTTSTPFGPAYPMQSHHVNGGAIAGGVIGGLVG
ncbi:MAG: hypothetical protein Q9168_006745, partial [Polycauliona sp. 1 TL-2023]